MIYPHIKVRWVAALRSGEYMQARRALRLKRGGYDPLGVLCDLFHKETGQGEWKPASAQKLTFTMDGVVVSDLPPDKVKAWAGPAIKNWSDLKLLIAGETLSLVAHSDGGVGASERTSAKSFNQIADAIEEQL